VIPTLLLCAAALAAPELASEVAPEVAPAVPDAASLVAAWAAVAPQVQAEARIPLDLDAQDLARVAQGDIARHREHMDGVDRVLGIAWSAQPREALWVAIIDDACDTLVDGLVERHLPAELPGQKILFQHVALPWPLANRQWIIDIRNSARLYTDTAGAAWERTWTLADHQEQRRTAVPGEGMPEAEAVWTPLNQGGWLLVDAGPGSLVVYHARADVGGAVPDDLATRLALATLKGMLRHVLDRAALEPAHYGPDHAPIQRPDGSPIPGWQPTAVRDLEPRQP